MDQLLLINQEFKNTIKKCSYPLFFGAIGYAGYCYYYSSRNTARINDKQRELHNKKSELLKKLKDLGTPINNMEKITSLNLSDLIEAIEKGEFTSVDVLQAYQAKALIMDKEYNFITDLNPTAELDISYQSVAKKPLKSIPISIKECFLLKNCDCTYGMLDQISNPAKDNEIIIQILKLHGLIPFVKTNLSQGCLAIETSNPIYGETVNPFNRDRTCGGSSGGEGAILGCGASLIGLGSDIGGSIRIPSHYCGIFGFKPSSSRVSKRNSKCMFPYPNIICESFGPMARHFDDLVAVFKILTDINSFQLDPYCPPLCFDTNVFEDKKPLKIGYYIHLGGNQVVPVPAVERAVLIAKKALESAGHKLVEFQLPEIDIAVTELFLRSLLNDGGEGFKKECLKSNPVDPCIADLVKLFKMSNIIKKCLSFLLYSFDKKSSVMLNVSMAIPSVYKLWQFNEKVSSYREKVLVHWQNEQLDGIICPVLPICAPPLQKSNELHDVIAYTSIYNLLDYPAGSTPVTTVNQGDIDDLMANYPSDTKLHRKIIEFQRDSIGMPIGVQSVAMMWREEVCLRIMRDIATNIK